LNKTILLTGGSGTLGNAIVKSGLFKKLYYPTSKQLNILDYKKLKKFIYQKKISLIIHCAAIARIKKCEKNISKAIEVNIQGTLNIIKSINKKKISLIYISTDAVYASTLGNYSESDPIKPYNVYGWTKVAGEFLVKTLDKYLIIRTRFFNKDKIFFKYSANNIYSSSIEVNKLVLIIYKLLKKKISGIVNVGQKKISDYDNYKKYNIKLKSCSKNKIFKEINFKIGTDASLNINKLKKILYENR
jgi:dTDP-4-dehydrorhamnose reductase